VKHLTHAGQILAAAAIARLGWELLGGGLIKAIRIIF
jgi:hypothetical protein